MSASVMTIPTFGRSYEIVEEDGQIRIVFGDEQSLPVKPQAGGLRKASPSAKRKSGKRRSRYTSRQKKERRSKMDLARQIISLSENEKGHTEAGFEFMCENLRGPKGHEFRKAPCKKTLDNYTDYHFMRRRIVWEKGRGYYHTAPLEACYRFQRTVERVSRWKEAAKKRRPKSAVTQPSTGKPVGKRQKPSESMNDDFQTISEKQGTISLSTNKTSSTSVTSAPAQNSEELVEELRARISPGSFKIISKHLRTIDGRLAFAPGLPGHLEILLRRHGLKPSSPENPEATRGVA